MDKKLQAFFALIKAGLWGEDLLLSQYGYLDYDKIYHLAEEQSVIGLVAAGIDHTVDVKVLQEVALTFVGSALQLEQRNLAMNKFLEKLIEQLRQKDVYTLLVKGQGIAQCYERPLWRSSGDVDLLLSEVNYNNAKNILIPLASKVEEENPKILHQGMTIDSWEVELHGTLCSRLWKSVNNGINEAKDTVFYEGKVRTWMNGQTQVFLPHADEDVVFVFTHILQHFYHEGIGLRQICDLTRLLWTYSDTINKNLLEKRLRKMKLMSEWKAFGALAVNYLGMPQEKMPFYSPSTKWKRKANKLVSFIIETGNFGHNRSFSYYSNKPYFVRKAISLKRHMSDLAKQFTIFPLDTIKVWNRMIIEGIGEVVKGR